jgi:alpha-1,3-rhamnosyltransferase
MNSLLVTVIVPCYNHEKYVSECILSIVNQSYKNFELIVIDDGSTDSSVIVLEKLKEKYGFTLIAQQNSGLSATLNRGIQNYAKGEYITFCASDDYWALDKLELQVAFMESNPSCYMCYGKTKYIDLFSNVMNYSKFTDKRLRGGDIFEDLFLFKFHPPVNYLFRKTVFELVGFYNPEIYAEDYFMNLKISSISKIGFIDEYLTFYRIDNRESKISRFLKVSESHLKTIETYKDNPLYKKAKLVVYLRLFFFFSKFKKEKKLALMYLVKSSPLFYYPRFVYSCFKLLFSWK